MLVEGESLLNDGTALVLFTLILGVALGDPLAVPDLLVEFVVDGGAGAGVGVADAQARLRSLHLEHDRLREEETGRARRRLPFVEKRQIIEPYREALFDDAVQERLLADVDARKARLASDVAADEEEG